jgi:chitinase
MPPSFAFQACISFLLVAGSAATASSSGGLAAYFAAHPVSTQTAIPSVFANHTLPPSAVRSVLNPCPADCTESGSNPSNWTVYHHVDRLAKCNRTMSLDLAVYNPLDNPNSQQTIRSCTANFGNGVNSTVDNTDHSSCLPNGNLTRVQDFLQLAFNETNASGSIADLEAATRQLATFLSQQEPTCNDTISFTYSNSVAVGIFAGSGLQSQGVPALILEQFAAHIQSIGFSESALVQLCAKNNRSSKYSFGIVANAQKDLAFVQNVVATWASGECITSYDGAESWQNVTISIPASLSNGNTTFSNATYQNSAKLRKRSDCTTTQIVSGDTCKLTQNRLYVCQLSNCIIKGVSLAAECGISQTQFKNYNTGLCDNPLIVGQHVCCSTGTLPNFAPQPNPDGTCASYLVVTGDNCAAIAAANSLTNANLESFNANTWGWMGCDTLDAGINMCLSTGAPPMPAPVTNAICGPQKPGTVQPGTGITLASLNPCPLNACCDKWGQCGTTAEFCTITESPTGAPGTAAAGTNGCISNCGTDIVVGSAPAEYMNVGYFEAWDQFRPCLNKLVTSMDLSAYTHIHMSFGTVKTDYTIDVSTIRNQFLAFTAMTGFKRILSIGGWDFSTNQETYFIFRDAVTAANVDTFVANIVSFVETYALDGIDIDWECKNITNSILSIELY